MANLMNLLSIRLPAAAEPQFVQEPDKSGWPAAQREQEVHSMKEYKAATSRFTAVCSLSRF